MDPWARLKLRKLIWYTYTIHNRRPLPNNQNPFTMTLKIHVTVTDHLRFLVQAADYALALLGLFMLLGVPSYWTVASQRLLPSMSQYMKTLATVYTLRVLTLSIKLGSGAAAPDPRPTHAQPRYMRKRSFRKKIKYG